ncbi:hypothetical protein Tco_1034051, partial [Tanacetum coccineum]
MLRWTCRRAELEVETIINKMREGWLRWFGHVKRRPQSTPVRRVGALVVDDLRRRGRPKLRWEDRVKHDMKEVLLSEDMTSNRNKWRARIRLGDDCLGVFFACSFLLLMIPVLFACLVLSMLAWGSFCPFCLFFLLLVCYHFGWFSLLPVFFACIDFLALCLLPLLREVRASSFCMSSMLALLALCLLLLMCVWRFPRLFSVDRSGWRVRTRLRGFM